MLLLKILIVLYNALRMQKLSIVNIAGICRKNHSNWYYILFLATIVVICGCLLVFDMQSNVERVYIVQGRGMHTLLPTDPTYCSTL